MGVIELGILDYSEMAYHRAKMGNHPRQVDLELEIGVLRTAYFGTFHL